MVEPVQRQQLLERVMDGLDDLYDERFGGPADNQTPQRVEVWLARLLLSTASALEGSEWEAQLRDAALEIQELMRSGLKGDALGDAALAATSDLRSAIAAEI